MCVLDHVVAHVERVYGVGEYLDTKRIDEAGRLKRLIPPACAFDKRRTDRFRRGVVHVVDDRLHRFAACRAWILLLEAMARREALHELSIQRLRVVLIADAEKRRTRIGLAHVESRLRQRHKAVTLADRDRFGVRRHVAHISTGIGAGERERDFDLGVLRERLGVRHVDRAARAIERKRSLLCATQGADRVVRVAQHEVGCVDQHTLSVLRFDGEAEDRTSRETFLDAACLVGVRRHAAESRVLLDQQHTRPAAREGHQSLAAKLIAIETDVIGAHAPRQRCEVDELLLHRRDLEIELAAALIPVQRKETVALRHAGGPGADGRQTGGGRRRGGSRRGGRLGERGGCAEQRAGDKGAQGAGHGHGAGGDWVVSGLRGDLSARCPENTAASARWTMPRHSPKAGRRLPNSGPVISCSSALDTLRHATAAASRRPRLRPERCHVLHRRPPVYGAPEPAGSADLGRS